MKKFLILCILSLASCKPEVYLGPLDSPLGNWTSSDSKYYFAGEEVYEDSSCYYSAISFYKDSLCCIEGIKGTFNWSYEADRMTIDSTVWRVVELSGKFMELDYIERLVSTAVSEADSEITTEEESVKDESGEQDNDDDDAAIIPTIEYKGRTIETDGSAYWYTSDTGEKIPCYPKEKEDDDGSVSVICWWDTRSDFYKPF